MWMIWVAAHRGWFFGVMTLVVWVTALYWYFRTDLKRMVQNGRAHNWSANMESKTGTGGLTKTNH